MLKLKLGVPPFLNLPAGEQQWTAAQLQNAKRIFVVFVPATFPPADSHRRRDYLQQVSAPETKNTAKRKFGITLFKCKEKQLIAAL